jgi:hypothetical protein
MFVWLSVKISGAFHSLPSPKTKVLKTETPVQDVEAKWMTRVEECLFGGLRESFGFIVLREKQI